MIRNNIVNNGNYDFIRVTKNSAKEKLDIINPMYSNNYFYGSSKLDLDTKPDDINLSEITLSQNEVGQYYVSDSTLNVGATILNKLDFNSDVGSNF